MSEFMLVWLPALVMGILGSAHCLGMCGGITVALSSSCEPKKQAWLSLIYQLFRVVSYSLLGAIAGGIGGGIDRWTDFPILMTLAGILLIMLGLYLMGQWNLLTLLERLGGKLWRAVQPLQKRFLPLRKSSQAMSIGLLWGLMPCGLVYSALALASASGGAMEGMVTMLFFGLGTLPALYLTGVFAKQLLSFFKHPNVRIVIGILFIAWGSYQIYFVYSQVANPAMTHHKNHH